MRHPAHPHTGCDIIYDRILNCFAFDLEIDGRIQCVCTLCGKCISVEYSVSKTLVMGSGECRPRQEMCMKFYHFRFDTMLH